MNSFGKHDHRHHDNSFFHLEDNDDYLYSSKQPRILQNEHQINERLTRFQQKYQYHDNNYHHHHHHNNNNKNLKQQQQQAAQQYERKQYPNIIQYTVPRWSLFDATGIAISFGVLLSAGRGLFLSMISPPGQKAQGFIKGFRICAPIYIPAFMISVQVDHLYKMNEDKNSNHDSRFEYDFP